MTRDRSLPAALALSATLLAAHGCALFPPNGDPPAEPVPLSPAEAADVVADARTRFSWEPVEGALWYDFHVFDRATRDIGRHRVDGLRASEACDPERCSVTASALKSCVWKKSISAFILAIIPSKPLIRRRKFFLPLA